MVKLESEGELTREEVAVFLRKFADELTTAPSDREGGRGQRHEEVSDRDDRSRRVTVIVGGESATVSVPETVAFDVEVSSRSAMLSSGVNQEIKFDLSWELEEPDDAGPGGIEVE